MYWSMTHQSEAQLSKVVNKGTCWENQSSSLVTSIRLLFGSFATNSHFLDTYTHPDSQDTDTHTQLHIQTHTEYLNTSGTDIYLQNDK